MSVMCCRNLIFILCKFARVWVKIVLLVLIVVVMMNKG